jgi:hypothetical protein
VSVYILEISVDSCLSIVLDLCPLPCFCFGFVWALLVFACVVSWR